MEGGRGGATFAVYGGRTAGRGEREEGGRKREDAITPSGGCKLQRCGMPIPADRLANNAEFCCNAHKDEFWKLIRETGKAALAAGQGKLF